MAVELLGDEFIKTAEESLEDSMQAFRDAHRENSDQILNIHEGRKKNAPRVYVHKDFPAMRYHSDGRECRVNTPEEDDDATRLGYRVLPYIKARAAVLSREEEKASADKRFTEQEEQLRVMSDTLARMQGLLEEKTKKTK